MTGHLIVLLGGFVLTGYAISRISAEPALLSTALWSQLPSSTAT